MRWSRSVAALLVSSLALASCGRSGLSGVPTWPRAWPDAGESQNADLWFLAYVRQRFGRENALNDAELERLLASDRFVCELGGKPDERRCRASFRARAHGLLMPFPPYTWTIYDDAELTVTAQRYAPGWWRFTDTAFRRLTDRWGDQQRRDAERRQAQAK